MRCIPTLALTGFAVLFLCAAAPPEKADTTPPADAKDFEFRLSSVSLNRWFTYDTRQPDAPPPSRDAHVQLRFALYGPEGVDIFRSATGGYGAGQAPFDDLLSALKDGDGNDLRGPDTQLLCMVYGHGAKRPDENKVQYVDGLMLTFKAPAGGAGTLARVEGYVSAERVVETGKLEVRPLKDNLGKDFYLSEGLLRFTAAAGNSIGYVYTPKDFKGGQMDRGFHFQFYDADGAALESRLATVVDGKKLTATRTFDKPVSAGAYAVVTYPVKVEQVKLPFKAENVQLPRAGPPKTPAAAPTDAPGPAATELAEAKDFQFRLWCVLVNRTLSYDTQHPDAQPSRSDVLSVDFALYGPEGVDITRTNQTGRGTDRPPSEDHLSALKDADGNDLRGPDARFEFSLFANGWKEPKADKARYYRELRISLAPPAGGARTLALIEGYAVAVRTVETGKLEVKPLKDNLEKDFKLGSSVLRFKSLAGKSVQYELTRKESPRWDAVKIVCHGPDGAALQVASMLVEDDGKWKVTVGFDQPIPDGAYAVVTYPARVEKVKLPFKAENVQLP